MKLLTFLIGLVLLSPLNLQAQPVSFSDFSDVSALTLNSDTGVIANPVSFNGANVLRLTDGLGQQGSAFLTTPISLADDASFSTLFTFQISDGEGIGSPPGADGIVFVVQTVSDTAGGGGGGIGYAGLQDSVGIEFDTFFNSGGAENDPDGNHVGIDLDGNIQSVATASFAEPFNNGEIWFAWVDYNGATDLLEVRVAESSVRPESAALSYTVDLVSVLGQTDAFIGFTSGTGAGANDHDIRSWFFDPEFDPIGATIVEVPTVGRLATATMVLMLLLAAFFFLRRSV